jgi:NAD(P)-dependent dehydrogenase (short-subunit alcohol dehydrogenase family)
MATFGSIHVLCNNAAIEIRKDFRDLEAADWDAVLSVDLRCVFLATRPVIPHLIQAGGGSVINIASVQAIASTGQVAAYAAAKPGILALTRDLAQDFGQFNVRVIAICPGCIDTPMKDRAGPTP